MSNETGYVVIIGSSNIDLNIYSKRFPNPGETVTGGTFKQFLGGKGANQAVASIRSGTKTIFIGKIGLDLFGDQMVSQLRDEGINMDHVIRDPQEPSGVAFILIDENGENMISVAPGANFKLTPNEIRSKTEIIKNANAIVVQMEVPTETIQEVFTIASKGNVIKILNPAPLKPIPQEILNKVDIIVLNEGELFRLHSLFGFKNSIKEGKQKIIHTSRSIAHLGISYIITTLGSKGCIIFNGKKNNFFEVPALKVKPVDTVGAGDCFIGVLASMLSRGETILDAVKYATVASSIAVTRKGAQKSMPFLNEIQKKIKELNGYIK
ncbi:MAG: ribokinase [Promethearchaeota archaeon]|nr:MAG: ribokinase [Candidatus Lokiarchaeota archaeon]